MKPIRKAVSILTRGSRRVLRLYFKFDAWHQSTLYERKYARDIIRHLNARPAGTRNAVVEIGCGLGDIIRHLHYGHRIGYDLDVPALDAARFLSRITFNGKIVFDRFDFPATALTAKADSIIMVNWIHHIPPPILKTGIAGYFHNNLLPGGELIIDTVQDKAYKFNHDIGYLAKDLPATISILGEYDRQRTIWSIKK